MKKKLITLLITLTATLCLTGCENESLRTFISTDFNEAMNQRVVDNLHILEQLYSANFISKSTYDELSKSLSEQAVKYAEAISAIEYDEDKNQLKGASNVLKSINRVSYIDGIDLHNAGHDTIKNLNNEDWTVYWTENGTIHYIPYNYHDKYNSMKYLILTNFLKLHENSWANSSANLTAYHANPEGTPVGTDSPVILLDSKISKEVNEKFDFDVYVLSPNILTADNTGSIDGVMKLLQSSITTNGESGGATITNIGNLNNYFVPAVDEDGDPVKLLEMEKDADGNLIMPEEYQLISVSKDQGLNGTKAEPGYDLIIKQLDVPIFSLKFSEFNQEAFDNLNELMGINDSKYVFYTKGDTKRVYLLEYPVSVLTSLQQDANNNDRVTGTIEKSGLGINLYTGNIIKYDSDGNGGWLASGEVVSESVDKYLTTDSASSNNVDGISSFIVKGMTTTAISHSLVNGGAERSVACGRIILRDYLEATFAPGFNKVDDENVICFGRKIRILFENWEEEQFEFNGKKSSKRKQYTPYWDFKADVGYFVDKNGAKIETSPTLKITDFCDITKLYNKSYDKCEVKVIAPQGIKTGYTGPTFESGSIPKINELARRYTSTTEKVNLTDIFPGENIGKSDYKSDAPTKQRFYCVATTKGLFDSALFSDWINSTSTTASLEWWNQYLSENGFIYQLSHEEVNEYLSSNYKYELSQNGVIILDLETVAKIQEQFDDDSNKEKVSGIRTFFMILGYILMGYSIMLMLCWVIDTNADVGVKLLEKVTFGNWIGVKYEEDIPYRNINDRTYLTAGKMFTRCIILIVLGLILIKVNIFRIVLSLIELFGPFASQIERIVKGFR